MGVPTVLRFIVHWKINIFCFICVFLKHKHAFLLNDTSLHHDLQKEADSFEV